MFILETPRVPEHPERAEKVFYCLSERAVEYLLAVSGLQVAGLYPALSFEAMCRPVVERRESGRAFRDPVKREGVFPLFKYWTPDGTAYQEVVQQFEEISIIEKNGEVRVSVVLFLALALGEELLRETCWDGIERGRASEIVFFAERERANPRAEHK